ncbi:MAG: type I restriction enzyme endonuclease domain-containing protein [Nitrospirota bacterium]
MVDIFASAGIRKPDISILSDEFLEEVRHMPQRIGPVSERFYVS